MCPRVKELADGVVFLPVSYLVPDRYMRRMARCVVELLRQEEEEVNQVEVAVPRAEGD